MADKKIYVADGEFEDVASAVEHAKAVAKDPVWPPDMGPGLKSCVVDESGDKILEISSAKLPELATSPPLF